MSYNSGFPPHDTNLSSLYYYATNPSGTVNQPSRTASPATSTDAPQNASERDPFSAHVSPTPGHFTPISGSRNASSSHLGWPPSVRGTPLSYTSNEASQYGSLNAFAGAPVSATPLDGDQNSLGQGYLGFQGYMQGGTGGPQTAGTPDIPHAGLNNGFFGTNKLSTNDSLDRGLSGGGLNAGLNGSFNSTLNGGLNSGHNSALNGFNGGFRGSGIAGGVNGSDGSLNASLNGAHSSGSSATVGDLSSRAPSSATKLPIGAAAAPGFGALGVTPTPSMPNWVYLDLSSILQGPFSSIQMTEWVAYFTETVMLKREQDSEFVPFGTLQEATGSINPFAMPFSEEKWNAVMRTAVMLAAGLSEGRANDSTTVSQQASPQNRESKAIPNNSVESSLADLKLSQKSSESYDSTSPEYQPVVASQIGKDAERTQDTQAILDESSFQMKPNQQRATPAGTAVSATTKESTTRNKQSPQSPAPGSRIPMSPAPGSISTEPQSQESQNSASQATQLTTPVKSQPQQQHHHHQQQQQGALTRDDEPAGEPWRKPSLQAVSLSELKQKEMEKQKRVNESPGPRKVQPKSWTQLPLGDEATDHASAATKVNPGANNSTNSTPLSWNLATPVSAPKSLAEIQKEAQAKKVQTKPTYSSALAQTSSSSSQSRPSANSSSANASAQSPYNGRFSALNEQAHPRAKQGQSAQPRSSRPQATVKAASVTAAANQAKPTDELIQWAKISFKSLSKDVNPMELLDVFLSLPANNEAKEFIAESIYSYSKTLDGRRFAHDFLSRKKLAEQSMKPNETWQDVLKRFNPTVEQDPSFKVVTNKRVKPLARPEGMRA